MLCEINLQCIKNVSEIVLWYNLRYGLEKIKNLTTAVYRTLTRGKYMHHTSNTH